MAIKTSISPLPRVAVVGATGAAGSTLLQILAERSFPMSGLTVLASARSAGRCVGFRGQDLVIEEVSDGVLRESDIVFFAAGASTSRAYAPVVAESGGVAVDKSSAFRMNPDVPLIVPEANGHLVARHRGILSNPNCVAVPLAVTLAPLDAAATLTHVTVSTYQAASGAGQALVQELREQTLTEAAGEAPEANVYPHVLQGNVVPGGWTFEEGETEEEKKVRDETRRVLDLPDLPVSVTTVRVPVPVGHSIAVWAEFAQALSADDARDLLSRAPGIRVIDDPASQHYPTPRLAAGTDVVLVGRIRADHSRQNGLILFISVDNLRKGAATNAVQVAELVLLHNATTTSASVALG